MTSHGDSIDDLLVLSRRGALSERERRRLREALAAEPETRLLDGAGRAFDDEAPIEAGDEALVERMARAVERARRPSRRVPRWPVVRAALAGALAASFVFAAVEHYQKRAPAAPGRSAVLTEPSASSARPSPHGLSSPAPSAARDTPAPLASPSTALPSAAVPGSPHATRAPAADHPERAEGEPRAPAVAGFPDAQPPADPSVSASSLFSAANQARTQGDLTRATLLYRKLEATFPASSEALASHVTLGMIELQRGNPSAALEAFQGYLTHGGGTTRAEALWGKAQALRRLGRSDEERAALSELETAYPSSAYAGAAGKRLTELH